MNKATFRRLLGVLKPYGFYIFLAILSALIGVSLSLLGPILIGDTVDLIIGQGQVDFPAVARILIFYGITLLVSTAFQWLTSVFTSVIVQNTTRDLSRAAIAKLNAVPLRYIDTTAHGDIISRVVNDISQVGDGLTQGLTQLFTGIITILGTLGFMLSVNIVITVIVVLVTPLSIFVASFIVKRTNKYFSMQSEIQGRLSAHINETINNQKVIKAFTYEQRAEEKFCAIDADLHASGIKAQFNSSLANPSTRFVNGLVYASVGIFGSICAIRGLISIGQVSSFLSYANQYTKPFNEVSGVIGQIQTAFASANRVFELLDEPEEVSDGRKIIDPSQFSGSLAMEHVAFSYTPERKLIENLNLQVKPGDKIAIVGPTGCGKTTLINLLMRFYDVDEGAIFLDGTDIREFSRNSLRGQYGMVLQETWVATGTIRENIAYGKPDATMEEVVAAAKAARAHGFITRMKDGYDTIISDRTGSLSQGQRQLLSIARVMLVDPPMLILDEATSNIDTRTELYIQEAFNKMMQGRTSFIVAHRLSTILEADNILVMNQGHILEQGRHEELLAKGGFYAQLYQSQFAKSK